MEQILEEYGVSVVLLLVGGALISVLAELFSSF